VNAIVLTSQRITQRRCRWIRCAAGNLSRIAGRWGVPDDFGIAAFLASSASDYVNGSIVKWMAGGWDASPRLTR
jgi:hypothetical protein